MGLSKNRLALNPLMNHQYPFDLNMKILGAILQFWTDEKLNGNTAIHLSRGATGIHIPEKKWGPRGSHGATHRVS